MWYGCNPGAVTHPACFVVALVQARAGYLWHLHEKQLQLKMLFVHSENAADVPQTTAAFFCHHECETQCYLWYSPLTFNPLGMWCHLCSGWPHQYCVWPTKDIRAYMYLFSTVIKQSRLKLCSRPSPARSHLSALPVLHCCWLLQVTAFSLQLWLQMSFMADAIS